MLGETESPEKVFDLLSCGVPALRTANTGLESLREGSLKNNTRLQGRGATEQEMAGPAHCAAGEVMGLMDTLEAPSSMMTYGQLVA